MMLYENGFQCLEIYQKKIDFYESYGYVNVDFSFYDSLAIGLL